MGEEMRCRGRSVMGDGLSVCLAAIALVLAVPMTASSATPIRECGNYGWPRGHRGDRPIFTFRPIEGAGTYNITTRVSPCRTAYRIIRRVQGRTYRRYCNRDATRCRVLRFTCREVRGGHEFSDMRCTGEGNRVVRWQSGA